MLCCTAIDSDSKQALKRTASSCFSPFLCLSTNKLFGRTDRNKRATFGARHETEERASPDMAWINGCDSSKEDNSIQLCPSCSHPIATKQRASSIQELPGLPAGVKFDPMDQELLEHLEGKVRPDSRKLHPLIDDFIPTLNGENGICYTHPEKLPGVSRDGQVRHFFHCPSKAYTTGTRKRRKVDTNTQGGETRWHKTGKTRPILADGAIKGYKKILVLYTNYGKMRKPEKTNWVMHQYHLGSNEEERDGELVVSKVFYQTQPRQCGSTAKDEMDRDGEPDGQCQTTIKDIRMISFYDSSSPVIACNQQADQIRESSSQSMLTNISVHENASSFLSGL